MADQRIFFFLSDGANELCVPESLSALQSVVGTIGKNDLDLPTLLSKVKTLADSDYKNIACTGCIKQAYTIGAQVFPNADLLNLAQTPITDTCGASFVGKSARYPVGRVNECLTLSVLDGQNVPGVSETAHSGEFVAVSQKPSSAASFKGIGIAGPAFATLSAAFVLLL